MFSKAIVVSSLALLAVATPTPQEVNQCNTGSIHCCNSVQSASDPVIGLLAGLLGIVLGPITSQVGFNCSPLEVRELLLAYRVT
jgi:hypothetical protein